MINFSLNFLINGTMRILNIFCPAWVQFFFRKVISWPINVFLFLIYCLFQGIFHFFQKILKGRYLFKAHGKTAKRHGTGSILSLLIAGVLGVLIVINIKSVTQKITQARNRVDGHSRFHSHKGEGKQFVLRNLSLPVYTEHNGKGKIKKLMIDFTIETSNKYTKEYLSLNTHLIKDRFNGMARPLPLSFVLRGQGRTILKEKLKREINRLIDELRIKGSIEEVTIHSILVGQF